MPQPRLTEADLAETLRLHQQFGNKAHEHLGVPRNTFLSRLSRAQEWQAGRYTPAPQIAPVVGIPQPAPPPQPQLGDSTDRDVKLTAALAAAKQYKAAYERAINERDAEERLIALFKTSIGGFPGIPKPSFTERVRPAQKTGRGVEVPVLLLSDQQIGETIALEETYGINAYDFNIYQQRLEHLEERLLDILTRHQTGIFDELVVLSLGDNISGRIHEELEKHGAQHVIDQVYLGALTTALFVYRLARFGGFKRVRFSGVSGNHGRLGKEKEAKKYYKNFDYLFHSIVATALRNVPEIDVFIPRSGFTVVEVAGHRILQSHGHELPPSSLGIPLYSINRASANYQELLSVGANERFSYWVMGHFHRPLEMDGSIVNGTMAGLSEFGIGKFKPIQPMQRLLGFHSKWGLAWQYPIRLDLAPKTPKVYTFESDMATPDAIQLLEERLRSADSDAA